MDVAVSAVAQLLRDGADQIERHGWCQGRIRDWRGRVDAIGALQRAAGRRWFQRGPAALPEVYWQAVDALGMHLGGGAPAYVVSAWNDQRGRTAAEVTTAMRRAADRVEAQS